MLVNKSTILMKNVNRGNCVCGGRGWNKYENSILKKTKKGTTEIVTSSVQF